MRRGLLAAALLLAAAAPTGSDREPGGYAVRLRVTPASGGGVQRVTLPAAAIAALRTRDGVDVRVFDAHGRVVPIARADPGRRRRQDELTALLILGERDAQPGARVSVQLDEQGRPRVAEVASGDGAAGGFATVGALLDARGIGGRAERLDLDLDVPAGRPVRFTVEASRDLDRWRSLGDRTGYRAPGAGLLALSIPLGAASLDREYLRVGWNGGTATVRRAVLVSAGTEQPLAVRARPPGLADDHALEFVAPDAPLSTIRVVPAAGDGAVAIRVLGRDDAEQSWSPLSSGIASAAAPAMALSASPRVIRIEADRRGAGFSAPPAIELGFAPQAVAFAAPGPGPFVLAAGRAGAPDPFLPLDALSPTGELAAAEVARATAAPLVLSAPDERAGKRRQWVLWGVLLVAVVLLGGLVWWSARALRAERPRPE